MSSHGGEIPMYKKIINWSMVVIITLGIGMMLRQIYFIVEPFQKPDITLPMPVEFSVIARGDEQTFVIEYTKYDEAEVVGTRTIQCEDGNLVTLTQIRTNLPIGSGVIHSIPFVIPQKTSLGMCKLVVNVRYDINPHKVVFDEYETVLFEVIE